MRLKPSRKVNIRRKNSTIGKENGKEYAVPLNHTNKPPIVKIQNTGLTVCKPLQCLNYNLYSLCSYIIVVAQNTGKRKRKNKGNESNISKKKPSPVETSRSQLSKLSNFVNLEKQNPVPLGKPLGPKPPQPEPQMQE